MTVATDSEPDDSSRQPQESRSAPEQAWPDERDPRRHTAVIVGAGITGIAVSLHFAANGIDHILLERADSLGGVWRSHRWPGVRCDTEIVSYSYSFRPMIADRPLVSGRWIIRYLENIATDFGICGRIVFGATVKKATFDDTQGTWSVETTDGRYICTILVNANGYFADGPYMPEFNGVESFSGDVVHLSQIADTAALKNKRLILVGSGASAVSAAPALCEIAESVVMLQRSPSYIFEDDNRLGLISRLARRMQKLRVAWPIKVLRFSNRLKNDLIFVMFRAYPRLGKAIFERHWRGAVDSNSFEEGFRPRYDPWEQRIPVAVGLKACLRDGRLRIVTGEIDRFIEDAVLLMDGRRLPGDVCILATGFDLDLFKFDLFRGARKITPERLNFFKGMMLGGVPNYFQPFGVVHATWTQRIESVARLITKIVRFMADRRYAIVEVAPKDVPKRPRITPNYIMRNIDSVPAIHGTFELPTVDDCFRFGFRKRDYVFTKLADLESVPNRVARARRQARKPAR